MTAIALAISTPVGPAPTITKVIRASRLSGSPSISAFSKTSGIWFRKASASARLFSPRSKRGEFIMAKVAVIRASRKNQIIVANFQSSLVICVHDNVFRDCINSCRIASIADVFA